jgi:hypothetical protein
MGPKKGWNQVTEGNQEWIWDHTWLAAWEFWDFSLGYLACSKMWLAHSSTASEVLM